LDYVHFCKDQLTSRPWQRLSIKQLFSRRVERSLARDQGRIGCQIPPAKQPWQTIDSVCCPQAQEGPSATFLPTQTSASSNRGVGFQAAGDLSSARGNYLD